MTFYHRGFQASQRGSDGFDLINDFRTVAPFNDHSLDTFDLPLDAIQSFQLGRMIMGRFSFF